MPRSLTLPALLALALSAPATADDKAPPAHLIDGKFGKALDASRTPQAYGGDARYRTPPLTVECWARLNSKRGFNVLVSSDPKSSAQHWEIYSYDQRGTFAAYLPGYEPAEVVSKKNICDQQWHHLAMTFDGKAVSLYVDGQRVHLQAVKPRPGLKPAPGPLSVGQAIDGSSRIGCDGAIDEVRISRVIRKVALPKKELPVDADTVALWRFDGSDNILADPAWTPPPAEVGEPWERMTDPDWVDARLRQMDTGPTFNGTLAYTHEKKRVLVYKGTAIRLGEKGEAAVMFDRNQLRLAAGWTGGYLSHSDRRFGLLNTPTPAGTTAFTTPSGPGWADAKGQWENKHPATAPLPHTWGRYAGMYLHGKRVVLSYTVNGAEVLESPWVETVAGQLVFVRDFHLGPTTRRLSLAVAQHPGAKAPSRGVHNAWGQAGGQAYCVQVKGELGGKNEKGERASFGIGEGPQNRIVQSFFPSDQARRFRVYHWAGPAKNLAAMRDALRRDPAPNPANTDLAPWTKGGPGRYPKPFLTKGEVAKDTAPYVVDTLTIPYDNPHKALFFCTGLDFLPDGRIAMCTCHGDVWTVKHDAKLEKVQWRRFATGLYHPLGLKVVDGKVVVLERGQLTRLHDLNGDGEADRYENLCHDWDTGAGEHSYDTCLETDAQGNFYFFKTGDTDLPHGGCLLRVSRDGQKVEVFATGFRHPIGLGVSPAGAVTGADQEGNWMPVTRVDVYKKGGFYGDMRAHHRPTAPKTYDLPLLWLPKSIDNSAGGQAWVAHDRFGLPKGQMLHFSYGRCKLYAIHTQRLGDVEQGFAADLGVKFLSGSARGRFHPADGHLYVCGLNGWQTAAQRDGCLQRVRYTGQPLPFPTAVRVGPGTIRLDFATKLQAKSAADARRYRVEAWNYRWSADYGSKDWSVKDPKRPGPDVWAVESATLGADGKSVTLTVKGLAPAMQVRVGYDVTTDDGKKVAGAVHGTIHRLEAKGGG